MPGYGFAEAPKDKVAAWNKTLRGYLSGRRTLLRVFLLVDARHGLKPVDDEAMRAALSALRVFAIGASWGGTRSLVAPQAVAQDRTATAWTAQGPLLRISIGLEEPDELWADLSRLLSVLGQAPATKAA